MMAVALAMTFAVFVAMFVALSAIIPVVIAPVAAIIAVVVMHNDRRGLYEVHRLSASAPAAAVFGPLARMPRRHTHVNGLLHHSHG